MNRKNKKKKREVVELSDFADFLAYNPSPSNSYQKLHGRYMYRTCDEIVRLTANILKWRDKIKTFVIKKGGI